MSFGAVAAVGGALIGASAMGDAADTQADSANAATAAQREMFNKQVELQAPFRDAGLQANNQLMYLLGLGGGRGASGSLIDTTQGDWRANSGLYESDPMYRDSWDKFSAAHQAQYGMAPSNARGSILSEAEKALKTSPVQGGGTGEYGSLMRDFSMADFEADPGYAFRMSEGTKAVEGGAAARGGLLSGAAQKALQKYGQESASQEYGNAFNRFTGQQTNKYNRLAGLVNTGQGATNQVSNAAGQFGQQQANNIIGAGNAQAAGQVGQANALVGGINQAFNGYQNNQLMNMIRNPSAGGTNWGNLNNQYFSGNQGMGG